MEQGFEMTPKKAIVLYEGNIPYAEVHNIEDGVFQNGRPLKIEELNVFAEIAKSENEITKKKCFPYRNIISFSLNIVENHIVWIYPEGKIDLDYSPGVKGLKSGKFFVPNIVFASNGKTVKVFAIKSKDILKLSKTTQLYNAPFLNTASVGDVCMGNAKVKKYNDLTEFIYSIEQAFFKSTFTHTSYNKIVKGSIIDAYNK